MQRHSHVQILVIYEVVTSFDEYLQRYELWKMIVVTVVAMTLFKSSILYKFSLLKISNIFGFLWYSSTVYFGGEPSGTAIDSKRTYKFIVFVSLLGGIIIWISYQSCLTAKLAVDIKRYPFKDMYSLSKTNWRQISDLYKKGLSPASIFLITQVYSLFTKLLLGVGTKHLLK